MRLLVLIFSLLLNTATLAKSEKVASFVFAKETTVENADKVVRKAKRKGKIFLHESIRTGAEGSAQIWTRDKAKFSVRPNSHITINKFLQTATECSVEVGLHSGSIRTTTGACGSNSVIKSSVGAITSLGTDHEVVYIPDCTQISTDSLYVEDCSSIAVSIPGATPGLYEKVNEGRVSLANTTGEIIVNAGEVGFISDANSAPEIIPMPKFFNAINTVKKKKSKKKVVKKKTAKKVEKKTDKKKVAKKVSIDSKAKAAKVAAEKTSKTVVSAESKEATPEEVQEDKEALTEKVTEVEEKEEVVFSEDDSQELELEKVDDAELELELDTPETVVVEINLPPVFDESLIAEITENSTESVQIPTKDNEGDTIVYSLEVDGAENNNDFFSISNEGILVFKQSADFETKNQYTVAIVATEQFTSRGALIENPNSTSHTYNVHVLDTNDAPTANTPINHPAKTYSNLAIDPSTYFDDVDSGDSLNYTITMGGKDEATLISEGVVTKNSDGTYDILLDSQGDFTIGLSAQDNDGESIDTQFTTSVSNYVLADFDESVKLDGTLLVDGEQIQWNGRVLAGGWFVELNKDGNAAIAYRTMGDNFYYIVLKDFDKPLSTLGGYKNGALNDHLSEAFEPIYFDLATDEFKSPSAMNSLQLATTYPATASLTYTISGSERFQINAQTGEITLSGLTSGTGLNPNLDDYHELSITVTDGYSSDVITIKVRELDVAIQSNFIANTIFSGIGSGNATTYLNDANYQPKIDAGVGVTGLGSAHAPGQDGTATGFNVNDIKERGLIELTNSNIYWGTWDNASATDSSSASDNTQFITEVRADDYDLAVPTTGRITYKPIAKSSVTNANGTTSGTLNDASLMINFTDNTGVSVFDISFNELNKIYNDAVTIEAGGEIGGTISNGVLMGDNGSHAGLIYNIDNHNGVRARGSVVLAQDAGLTTEANTPTNGDTPLVLAMPIIDQYAFGDLVAVASIAGYDNTKYDYSLEGESASRFSIDAATGEIKVTSSIADILNPFSTTDTYNLTLFIKVKDSNDVLYDSTYQKLSFKEVDISAEATLTANTIVTASATGNATATIGTTLPIIDVGLGVTKLGTYTAGTAQAFDPSQVSEQDKIVLSSGTSTVYWGTWDTSTNGDNTQFITEIRDDNDPITAPITGRVTYKPIAKSAVTNANGTTPGTLNDASLMINFTDNTGVSVFDISFNGLQQIYNDAVTLTAVVGSNDEKVSIDGSISNGVLMGDNGSHAGLIYNIADFANSGVYARGSVVLATDVLH